MKKMGGCNLTTKASLHKEQHKVHQEADFEFFVENFRGLWG